MARLIKTDLPISGKVGDLVYARTENGIIVRSRPNFDRNKWQKDPAYKRCREQCSEFGTVSKAASLIIRAFSSIAADKISSDCMKRLNSLLHEVKQTDIRNPHGSRTPANGDLSLLKGFEFNRHSSLESIFAKSISVTIDKPAGHVTVDIQPFYPGHDLKAPAGMTDVKFIAAAIPLNIPEHNAWPVYAESALIPLSWSKQQLPPLIMDIPPATSLPILVGVGITFYQDNPNSLYRSRSKIANPFTILHAAP